MRLHYLQHVPFEDPGVIFTWAKENGYPMTGTHFYRQDPLPGLDTFDWLIILGGPMNLYEEEQFPWLIVEKAFMKEAMAAEKVMIGFCLGAQLIADVIGGRVIKNLFREIGWFPVTMAEKASVFPQFSIFPNHPIVFEWHGDTFIDLPKDAIILASNEACTNQAFLHGSRTYGFQFHMEYTQKIIEELIINCRDELITDIYVQTAKELCAHPEYLIQINSQLKCFLNKLHELYREGDI